jgi:23S rRNA (cytosine1962-C5)-methyltransferase
VDWARRNAKLCHLEQRPIRWIVDDAVKFAKREKRRQNRYHGIILDPPSFGRGPKGEVFKIEHDLPPLIEVLRSLLAHNALFVIYSCHTPGFTPILLENQLAEMTQSLGGSLESGEMTVMDAFGRRLPSGSYARWVGPTSHANPHIKPSESSNQTSNQAD